MPKRSPGLRRIGCASELVTTIDAILLLSFGGPEDAAELLPFLRRVSHGRDVPASRLAQVEKQYLAFGGVSPINEQNRQLRAALENEVNSSGALGADEVHVYFGNRNSAPFLVDTLRQMRSDGIRRAAVIVTSPYSSYSGCRQYREDLAQAVRDVQADGLGGAPDLIKVRRYFDHPAFIEVMVDNVQTSIETLPPGSAVPKLVFTTHSLPISDAEGSGPVADRTDTYLNQHEFTAGRMAAMLSERLGLDLTWDLVFQSRSGPPSVSWLEPDISDHLTALAQQGTTCAIIVPIGFVSDHLEVRWDLDTIALAHAAQLGIACVRAATVGTDPRFVAALVSLVRERADEVPMPDRPALGPWGPAPDACPPGCCPNRRGDKPAMCGSS